MSPVRKNVLIWSSGIVLVVSLALTKFSNSGPKSEPFLRFKDYKVLAEGGDTQSQWILGRYYYSGVDVPKNLALSSYWFRKSAEKNHAEACYDLGTHYMGGVGVDINYVNAAFWLYKAACSNNSYTSGNAQIALGDMYARGGAGLEKDRFEAYAWYSNAAKGSYPGTKERAEKKLAEWGLLNDKKSENEEYSLAHNRHEQLSRRLERMKIDEQLFILTSEEENRR